jgi:putative ABC transport system permease protein
LKEQYLQEVRSVPEVATAAPVFMTAVYDESNAQAVYVGIERSILALRPSWHIQGAFPASEGELLIGSDVARKNGWQLGQQVKLPGLTGQVGRVAGILAPTHSAEDGFIHLTLADAQARFNHPSVLTHMLVRLRDPNALDRAVTQLRGCDAGLTMNVVPLAHVFQTIQSMVNSTRLLLGCLAVVAFLVAGAGVSNTILIAVAERQRELGMMRAMGASRADIFRLIWLETVETCSVGAFVGVALSFLSSRAVESWVRLSLPFAPSGSLLHWEWWIAGLSIGAALFLGSLAGLWPAGRASAVPPMMTIRRHGGWI